ncbi:MAG: right-handed parallel beta-helix repeat-containing protein [Planctomycetota bacterium]|nr:right-handed parallel beta-helix repeat-containing protein [Planctomycetota bacterium]
MPVHTDRFTRHRLIAFAAAILFILAAGPAAAETYYIATDGSDDNEGTIDSPFATFEHAIGLVGPGDTIFVRGGVYMVDDSITIDKAGAPGSPIELFAYADEVPILDGTNNPRHANPPQPRDDDSIAGTADALGIFIAPGSDWWHIRGLTIRNAPYYGVRVYGSHNIFEELVLIDNQAAGLELTGKEDHAPSHNLVLNCDSYLNFDPQTNGEDADGFAAKFDDLGPGNVFRGLRAWSNSDDGFDFWHATHPVLIDNCWSFDNGFFRDEWQEEVEGSWRGDGLGFKLGAEASELVLHDVVAFGNKAFGIDENGNGSDGGVVIYNATLVNNAKNGNPIQISLDDGRPHTVRNTIAFDVDGSGVTDFDNQVDDQYNTWNGIGVSADDFVSLDMDQLMSDATGPRDAGAGLPAIGLRLAPCTHLIDAGVDVGLPFAGEAPDLGAFETCPGDVDRDGTVSTADLLPLLAAWGTSDSAADINCDGIVDTADLLSLLGGWGVCG